MISEADEIGDGYECVGGFACSLIAVAPDWLSLVLVTVCRFAITGVYAVAFLYSSEIFPTVILQRETLSAMDPCSVSRW